MPRDVTTRWNSTYDMLSFAVKYRKAIEHITSDLKNDLRKYELTDTEWWIADELKETLKVSFLFTSSYCLIRTVMQQTNDVPILNHCLLTTSLP